MLLLNFLATQGCVTIADAEVLLARDVWRGMKKAQRELREILSGIGVLS